MHCAVHEITGVMKSDRQKRCESSQKKRCENRIFVIILFLKMSEF
jgi:hypothetical protein